MVARWRDDRLHLRSRRIAGSVSRQAGWHRPRAADGRSRIRRSSGVLAGRHAAGVCQHAQRRLRAHLDDGPALAAGEGRDDHHESNRNGRRLPAVVVTGWKMARLLVGSRNDDEDGARPMGSAATRRHLYRPARRHRTETRQRARQLLRQPEVLVRRRAPARLLHAARIDARDAAAESASRQRHHARVDRHRDRQGDRHSSRPRREDQPGVSSRQRHRLRAQGFERRRHLLHQRQARAARQRARRRVVAGRQPRRLSSPPGGAADVVAERVHRQPELRDRVFVRAAVVQSIGRSVRDGRAARRPRPARLEHPDRLARRGRGQDHLQGHHAQRPWTAVVSRRQDHPVRHRHLPGVLQRLRQPDHESRSIASKAARRSR